MMVMGCTARVQVLLFHIAVVRSNLFSLHLVDLFVGQGGDLIGDLEVCPFKLQSEGIKSGLGERVGMVFLRRLLEGFVQGCVLVRLLHFSVLSHVLALV